MPQKIFVNLPVRDLKKSMDFFGKLGLTFNAQFTDETAACLIISENILVVLTENKFKTFIQNKFAMQPRARKFSRVYHRRAGIKSTKWLARPSPRGGTTY